MTSRAVGGRGWGVRNFRVFWVLRILVRFIMGRDLGDNLSCSFVE